MSIIAVFIMTEREMNIPLLLILKRSVTFYLHYIYTTSPGNPILLSHVSCTLNALSKKYRMKQGYVFNAYSALIKK